MIIIGVLVIIVIILFFFMGRNTSDAIEGETTGPSYDVPLGSSETGKQVEINTY